MSQSGKIITKWALTETSRSLACSVCIALISYAICNAAGQLDPTQPVTLIRKMEFSY